MSDNKEITSTIFVAFSVAIIFSLILGSFYTISAGERGIILTFGKPSMDVSSEGFHWKVPIVQQVKKMEVRTKKIETDADSVTKDLQGVMTKIALNYHLNPELIPKLYQEVGPGYESRIINPAIQESVKAVMARYEIEELTENRPEVRNGIKEFISEKLSKYYIIVDDFNIVNFGWSEEFTKAIEEKLTAEQKKLKAERDLERIKVEAEQVKTQAEAEAYALKIKASAIEASDDVVTLKQIEAQLEAIEKWNGKLPQVTGGSIPLINLEGNYTN